MKEPLHEGVYRKRLARHSALKAVVAAAAVTATMCVSMAGGQVPQLEWEEFDVIIDSGPRAVPAGAAERDHVVYSRVVGSNDAAWIRVEFGEVQLAGSLRDRTNASIRVTSLLDGAQQTLNKRTIEEWQHTSAYFNGSWVLVEVLARPDTGISRITIDRVQAGQLGPFPPHAWWGFCDEEDTRVPTTAAPEGRGAPIACTVFLIGERCLLTSGHCAIVGGSVIHFNVPPSNPDGTVNFSHPDDQYVVDGESVGFENAGCALDWRYLGVFDNANTSLSPLAAQGEKYVLAQAAPPADGRTLRVRGYGVTPKSPLEWNQTLTVATGPYTGLDDTHIWLHVDLSPGNSGSAIYDESTGKVIGIVNCSGCSDEFPQFDANQGTAIHAPWLQAALSTPQGVCAPTITTFSASPHAMHVATTVGADPAPQALTVWTGSAGELPYTIEADVPWITVEPDDGLLGEVHTVSFHTDALPLGEHTAQILIEVEEESATAIVIPVTLEVVSCLPEWDVAPGGFDIAGVINAMTVFDDGSGPALYVAGVFSTIEGQPFNNIARWNGTNFSPVGGGVNGSVWDLHVFDDGNGAALYAAGTFSSAGDTPANRVARWDGEQWSALGGGVDQIAFALADFNDGSGPALYIGGHFLNAGGAEANRIARWDGTSWSALSDGVDSFSPGANVRALHVFDDGTGQALYVGGRFDTAGGTSAVNIARWDGDNWSSLGHPNGVNNLIWSLASTNGDGGPQLYAGGTFSIAGGTQIAHRIAAWDGAEWSTLGSGIAGETSTAVRAMTDFDDGSAHSLFVGGSFDAAGGNPAANFAAWNGTNWSTLAEGVDGSVNASAVFDDGAGEALYIAGNFTSAGGAPANQLAAWRPCPPPCIGDLLGDGQVGVLDLFMLLAQWGPCPTNGDCSGDLNNDDQVDESDLLILLAAWGECP